MIGDPPQVETEPENNGGTNPKMVEFTQLLEIVLRKHAGGFNVLCNVETEEGVVQVTPAQICASLIDAVSDLTCATDDLRKLLKRMNKDAAEEENEEWKQNRKRNRHG
jgi:hypothetical protein